MESYMYSENSYGGEKEPTAVWNNRVKENIHPAMQNLTPITPTDELRIYANDTDITEMIEICRGKTVYMNLQLQCLLI